MKKEITMEKIHEVINNLKKEKASRKDKIPGEILKIMIERSKCVSYLYLLYNEIKNKNITPEKWKKNVIYTIYQLKNFKPISLMNIIYKVYISIINNRLFKKIEEEEILVNTQAGFRKDRNTWQKIWTLKYTIDYQKKKNKKTHLIYIDLAKAYDSVEHWELEQILRKYGFNEITINIIKEMCEGN